MTQTASDVMPPLLHLGHLSTGTPLFSDHNKDGYPDRIHLSIGIAPKMNSGPARPGGILMNFPGASASESSLPGPWPCSPGCFWRTNRCQPWMSPSRPR